jgi:hypothetical protein
MHWRILLNTILSKQFGAAIDMLESAIHACPEDLWRGRLWNVQSLSPEFAAFWYIAYHALFWLDFYLSGSDEGFAPPPPFTLAELDPAGLLPENIYSKEELQTYLEYGREKRRAKLESLTEEQAQRPCKFPWGEVSYLELQLYNMRHIQEHASQLNLFLGQKIGSAPGWITGARRRQNGE